MPSVNQASKACWIHCNKCFVNHIEKQKKIFILTCYHIACEKCVGGGVKSDEVQCPMCKKASGARLICNNLHPKLKELFNPRPWTLKFDKAYSVIKFQEKQRNHFIQGCNKMSEYCKKLEEDRDRSKEKCRKAYITKKEFRSERKQLEAILRKFMDTIKNIDRSDELKRNESVQSIISTTEPSSPGIRGFIHPTYHAPESNDFTFDLPSQSNFSKSFML